MTRNLVKIYIKWCNNETKALLSIYHFIQIQIYSWQTIKLTLSSTNVSITTEYCSMSFGHWYWPKKVLYWMNNHKLFHSCQKLKLNWGLFV